MEKGNRVTCWESHPEQPRVTPPVVIFCTAVQQSSVVGQQPTVWHGAEAINLGLQVVRSLKSPSPAPAVDLRACGVSPLIAVIPVLTVCNDENPCEGMSRHATFENFGMAFLTLFQVSTGDNWNGIMKVTGP